MLILSWFGKSSSSQTIGTSSIFRNRLILLLLLLSFSLSNHAVIVIPEENLDEKDILYKTNARQFSVHFRHYYKRASNTHVTTPNKKQQLDFKRHL